MTLTDYVLQVLVEENPYIGCTDVRDRQITYEDAAVNIAMDIMDNPSKDVSIHVVFWLNTEFGDDLYTKAIQRTVSRIKEMTNEGFIKMGL